MNQAIKKNLFMKVASKSALFNIQVQNFQESSVKELDGDLFVGNSLQVSRWEEPLQKYIASLMHDIQPTNVLEIGYGFGFFCKEFRSLITECSQTILEAHPSIARQAQQDWGENPYVNVINEFWEIFLPQFDASQFDAVFMDAYLPLERNDGRLKFSKHEVLSALSDALPLIANTMNDNSSLIFIDASGELEPNDFYLNVLGFDTCELYDFEIDLLVQSNFIRENKVRIFKLENVKR